MGDIKLFQYSGDGTEELKSWNALSEKELHKLMEKNMQILLGIHFLASEYATGRNFRGYIDSLGLDENNCPVIIEYKRHGNDGVINQALYYLDWLMDHQTDFIHLVETKLGEDVADKIEFGGTRILCIASEFSRYDERAILHIMQNIELIRYKFFGDNLLMLERLNTSICPLTTTSIPKSTEDSSPVGMPPAMRIRLNNMDDAIEQLYLELLTFIEDLGDDVGIKFLKHYIALTRLKNFTSIQPLKSSLKLYVNLDPTTVTLEEGFSRDVREIGHHASGNLELDLKNSADLAKAKPLIEMAYSQN